MNAEAKTENTGTDLSEVQAVSRDIEIEHPKTGEEVGLRVTVRPLSHKEVKKAQRKNLDAQLQSRSERVTAEEMEENTLRLHVAAVESWDWYGKGLTFKGKKPECTPAIVREVFQTLPWLRDQVRTAFDDTKSFFAE